MAIYLYLYVVAYVRITVQLKIVSRSIVDRSVDEMRYHRRNSSSHRGFIDICNIAPMYLY